jgi:rubrerythrin
VPRSIQASYAPASLETELERTDEGNPGTMAELKGSKTHDNLKAAFAGETYEYTEMYPGMARTARDEGFQEVAEWFETLAKAEKSHAGRFQKAKDGLEEL